MLDIDGSSAEGGQTEPYSTPTEGITLLPNRIYYNNTLYADNATGGGAGAAEEYTTNENQIGSWIDGSPVYQKVYEVNWQKSGSIDISNDNIKMMIKAAGISYNPASGYQMLDDEAISINQNEMLYNSATNFFKAIILQYIKGDFLKPLLYHWDFTGATPLVDLQQGYTLEQSGCTVGSTGLSFTSGASVLKMPLALWARGLTYEITIATLDIQQTSNHNRLLSYQGESGSSYYYSNGFIYRSTGYWGVYDRTNGWQMSTISDKNYFNNCVLKIEITADGHWKIYKDNVLVFEPSAALPNAAFANNGVGAGSQAAYNMLITDLKIY